jgi:hypothetical protein
MKMKSVFNTVDILFGHFAHGFIIVFLYLALSLIAAFNLVSIPLYFFEYDAGLSDLDLSEVGLFIIFAASVWRFFARCFALNWTKWKTLKRFVFVIAFTELFCAFFISFYLIIELIDQGVLGVAILDKYADIQSFLSIFITIIAIYASTPLPNFYKSKDDAASNLPDNDLKNEQPAAMS